MTARALAAQNHILEGVEPAVVSELLAPARHGTYRPGEIIIGPADPGFGLLFVFSGSVKVFFESADGQQVMTKLVAGPGVVACAPGSDGAQLVTALSTAEVLVVRREPFFAALERSHRLTLNVLQIAGRELGEAGRRIRSFAFQSVEERLAELLLSFASQYGRPMADGVRIDLPLTQEELADMLGAARRSVTRSFQRWTRAGALRKRDGRFIVNEQRLRARRALDRAA
ncbi:MAG: Crp/Fnr family transcriptional regulator [Myxococcaceae bacterium]|nr:Crp/Fnr family transcriptional regulator [Myxococcaceae bacterium]